MDNQHDSHRRDECPAPGPHTIRLTSVWVPPRGPATAWLRSFGRPSGVGPDSRVMLVIEAPAIAALAVNATPLPAPPSGAARWAHDITPLLADRNELVLTPEITDAETAAGDVDAHGRVSLPRRYGRIALEILTLPAAGQ